MFCTICQNHILRKKLEEYFKRTTICIKCERLLKIQFEESKVPYHHQILKLKYSSVCKNTIFESCVFQDLIFNQGELLRLNHDETLDALIMALLIETTLYLEDYLRLDFIEYIQALEAIQVVLITA